MANANGKPKNTALLKAAKALSAAATSLAAAADALSSLCEEDDEDNVTVKSGGSASINGRTSVASLKASVVEYDSGDSDDDYMALAREAVRVASAAATPSLGNQTPAGT